MGNFKFYKNKTFALGLLTSLVCLFVLSGCKKDEITPGNYQAGTTPAKDTTTWQWQYGNGGTLPNWSNNQTNSLAGTKWVLTKIVTGFATSYPNDTIEFISNNNYVINNNAPRQYQLSAGVASTNKTLTLYYFYPFGGSHYSGEVGQYFISDGLIDNCEFTNIQNTTSTCRGWFVKI